MYIEAYDLDSLRKLVRSFQEENIRLKEQLERANIAYETENVFEEKIENMEEYDPDQGGRILDKYITKDLVNQYFSLFWGRTDVYAKRGSKGGYFPQCNNRWNGSICPKQRGEQLNCESCEHTEWMKLTPEKIINHLVGYKEDGSDVLGIYPLFPDGTCRFIVFDFDNHEKGAHVWIFFKKPVSASLVRNFGFLLLDKGSASINLKSFHFYDRMYPSQDVASSIGNLIALPLQGRALKDGNSAFVDKNWNAYPEQWDILLNHTKKLSIEDIERLMEKWQGDLAESRDISALAMSQCRPKPWKKNDGFVKSDVIGKIHIVLREGVYIDALNLMPRLQNQIRSMAAFDNPIFYKNKRLGYSNYYNFSAVYMGRDVDGYISIPRGLRDNLLSSCREAGIDYEIVDHREKGRQIRVSFRGDLRTQQDLAAHRLLAYDHGVLSAATAFGKTVVCSYLISERKVNTLILLQSKELLEQWMEELNKFLTIDEKSPIYRTKSGREKHRDSVIGILHGSKNTLTGIIDVAMMGSMYSKGKFNDRINSYRMVLMDECHHCGSNTSVEVMQKVNAKYVYGVSATPKRGDNLEKKIYMLLGPIRHSYTAKERAIEQGIGHYVYPRYTRVIDTSENGNDINGAYSLISSSSVRNQMILEDTRACVRDGRTPVILTKYKEQAKYLYDNLQTDADCVYLLYGDNSDKENSSVRQRLKVVSRNQSLILVATGQKIGEGFDYPRLDTLMLAAPVSFAGRLEQYIGRLNRDYEDKKEVIVYDYIDSHIKVFDNMYAKRLRTYKRTGFQIIANGIIGKQTANAIFDCENYTDVFEQDIVEAEKKIIVSSPELRPDKVKRFIYLVRARQETGCSVIVITMNPQNIFYGSPEIFHKLICEMQQGGIRVITSDEITEHFAIIDDELVWHGGMNLLGKEDAWDNLMRIKSA